MRVFICLTTQSDDGILAAFALCAQDRATALANAVERLASQPDNCSRLAGVLTQEEVTGMGMLLAAGRAGMSAQTSIEA